jgi:hypothetical protein
MRRGSGGAVCTMNETGSNDLTVTDGLVPACELSWKPLLRGPRPAASGESPVDSTEWRFADSGSVLCALQLISALCSVRAISASVVSVGQVCEEGLPQFLSPSLHPPLIHSPNQTVRGLVSESRRFVRSGRAKQGWVSLGQSGAQTLGQSGSVWVNLCQVASLRLARACACAWAWVRAWAWAWVRVRAWAWAWARRGPVPGNGPGQEKSLRRLTLVVPVLGRPVGYKALRSGAGRGGAGRGSATWHGAADATILEVS